MCLLQVLISPYSVRQSRACRPPVEPDPPTRPIYRGVSTSTRAFTGGLWPAARVHCAMHRSYAPMPSFGSSFRAIDREEHAEVVSTRVLRVGGEGVLALLLTRARTLDPEPAAPSSKCAALVGYESVVGMLGRLRRSRGPKLGRRFTGFTTDDATRRHQRASPPRTLDDSEPAAPSLTCASLAGGKPTGTLVATYAGATLPKLVGDEKLRGGSRLAARRGGSAARRLGGAAWRSAARRGGAAAQFGAAVVRQRSAAWRLCGAAAALRRGEHGGVPRRATAYHGGNRGFR